MGEFNSFPDTAVWREAGVNSEDIVILVIAASGLQDIQELSALI